MAKFDKQYRNILKKIKKEGVEELNKRTGHKTKAVSGVTIEIEDEFPLLALRKIPIRIFVAEQIWFVSGSRRVDDFLNKGDKIGLIRLGSRVDVYLPNKFLNDIAVSVGDKIKAGESVLAKIND